MSDENRMTDQPTAVESELKPCPFCGGKGRLIGSGSDFLGFELWHAYCEREIRCGISTPWLATKRGAINRWNRRTSDASLIDERDRLREAVENVMFDEWGYRESEAPDMQDELTRLGLLVEVPADEDFKREWDADTMLTFAWSPLAAKEKP